MTNIIESPPFMPIDERTREIWAILLELCPYFDNLKIKAYVPNKSITVAGDCFGKSVEKTIDISWAFQPPVDPLPLVRKVFADMEGK